MTTGTGGAQGHRPPARVTIADIAARAKVSTSAISYALNGRPGISEQTRARILAIAAEMNWRPDRSARNLTLQRVGTIGVVTIFRPDQPLWSASFGGLFLSGVQQELADSDVLLILHQVADLQAECDLYRRWRGERRVDGILLVNPEVGDPRLPLLEELGLPVVVVGDTRRRSRLSCVWTDDQAATKLAVDHLVSLGHRRIARLGGDARQLHFQVRERAFRAAMRAHGLDPDADVLQPHEHDAVSVAARVRRTVDPLTAVVAEESEQAVGLVSRLRDVGLSAPEDLAIVTWDDGPVATMLTPRLTALHREIGNYGRKAARQLLDLIDTGVPQQVRGTTTTLVVRESTAGGRNRG